MAEKLSRLIDDSNEVMNEILELKDREKRILMQLRQIEQPYRNILYKMYIKGKKLVDIASELGYEYKHICKKHGTALSLFDKTRQKRFNHDYKI